MTRVYQTFSVSNIRYFKQQMLSWANQFSICCFLDNHEYKSPLHSFECLAAVGTLHIFEPAKDFFSSLDEFTTLNNDWIFGHFNYDVKNIIEKGLVSHHNDESEFPEYFLFIPKVVLQLNESELIIGVIDEDAKSLFEEITHTAITPTTLPKIAIQSKFSRHEYLNRVKQLIAHIKRGNCYEINFCHEFFAHDHIDPASTYNQLTKFSPNPFSAYYKLRDKYLLCASPERFLSKKGNTIVSQPIKGTVARATNLVDDNNNRAQLRDDEKQRNENVMIVDLVRNDLSKVCAAGSVEVDELFGIYSFPFVHQMISTVSGKLTMNAGFADILKATFPMGSMTGAPKRKVMELIEEYECSKRGIYSGTVGYISPKKNFDFNVVIRSIVYNETKNYISYHVGSAITFYSDPQQEYDECILKAKAIEQIFSGTT